MFPYIFTSVFHRILDFKTGLNFYSDPFFLVLLPMCKHHFLLAETYFYRPDRRIAYHVSALTVFKKKDRSFEQSETYQPKFLYLFLFFRCHTFLGFFNLRTNLCFDFCGQLRIIMQQLTNRITSLPEFV